MKRVLFLSRQDLVAGRKLSLVSDVEMVDFQSGFKTSLMDAEIVIFHCELTNAYRVVKNRCGTTTQAMSLDGSEDRERFISYILESLQ